MQWVKLSGIGQIKKDDYLAIRLADKCFCAQARMIINPGKTEEEVVYNISRNHYFITSMVLDGSSSHKEVLVLTVTPEQILDNERLEKIRNGN